jgi:hypothetical protein
MIICIGKSKSKSIKKVALVLFEKNLTYFSPYLPLIGVNLENNFSISVRDIFGKGFLPPTRSGI